jgi:hypothetical protein
MSKSLDELALRKQLLQARSALYRLKIHQEFGVVRESFQWTNIGAKVITSLPVRSRVLGFILRNLRGNKGARVLAFAGKMIVFAKAAGLLMRLFRKS